MTEELLLDDTLLSGHRAVSRLIGPEIVAAAVNAEDLAESVGIVADASQLWGAGSFVYLPAVRGSSDVPPPWSDVLKDCRLDGYAHSNVLNLDFTATLHGLRQGPSSFAETIWSVFAMRHDEHDLVPLSLEMPDIGDDWFVAYLGAFGVLRDRPSEGAALRAGVRPDLAIDDLVTVERGAIESPDGQDLLRRLNEKWTPRMLTMQGLGVASEPWSQDLAQAPTWTTRGWTRQLVGSNIVVVYEPGSVIDFCLLWTLRTLHGLNRGLPLGLPITADVEKELSQWTNFDRSVPRSAVRLRGISRPFALTSLSVDRERLEEIAQAVATPWQVVPADQLLRAPHRPGIPSTDVTFFSGGRAIVDPWDAASRALLENRSPAAHGRELRVRVSVRDRSLPPLKQLRGGDQIGMPNWRDGGFDSTAPDLGVPLEIHWPTGFNVLRAAVREHGLDIEPSDPGLAVHALVTRMGDLRELDALKDRWVLERLDVLAQRRGMSWFRDRVRRLTADAEGVPELAERLDRIEYRLAEIGGEPGGEEQHELTISPVSQQFRIATARRWLSWAEQRGLLVRGVSVECPACHATGWHTVGELAPPLHCRGCGAEIRRPFPADRINFVYRASQLLLNVMNEDALTHALCGAWWVSLFRGGYLYGLHLGANFQDGTERLGEADVVLLLADGRLALGECKRRAAGLTQGDIDRIESIADRVDAAWTFYATPDWASQCGDLWKDLRRDLPERRRFALTGEQLLTRSVSVSHPLGVDPTAFEPWDEETIRAHASTFRSQLQSILDDLERPRRLDEWLLPQTGSADPQ